MRPLGMDPCRWVKGEGWFDIATNPYESPDVLDHMSMI